MKTEDRIIYLLLSLIEELLHIAISVFCLLLLALSVYSLFDTANLYLDASRSSILRFRPEIEKENVNLYEELKGSVSWLTLDGAGVDDPVMQGKDNLEYLNKNPYGEFSLSGSLFLDARNSPDFSDPYSLIYGHHMDHHMMFGALDQYMDEEFFESHTEGSLTVNGEVLQLEIFSVLICSAYERTVFEPGESEGLRDYILQNSKYLHEENWKEDERILAISTCRYPDTEYRTVVFARIKDHER